MSTVETFQNAAQQIRAAFGDAFKPVTYAVVSTPTYNTTSGAAGPGTVTKHSFLALFSRFSHYHMVTMGIPVDDRKLTFATLDAPTLVPRDGHLINSVDYGVWEVVRVMADPVDALRVLQIRKVRKAFP